MSICACLCNCNCHSDCARCPHAHSRLKLMHVSIIIRYLRKGSRNGRFRTGNWPPYCRRGCNRPKLFNYRVRRGSRATAISRSLSTRRGSGNKEQGGDRCWVPLGSLGAPPFVCAGLPKGQTTEMGVRGVEIWRSHFVGRPARFNGVVR